VVSRSNSLPGDVAQDLVRTNSEGTPVDPPAIARTDPFLEVVVEEVKAALPEDLREATRKIQSMPELMEWAAAAAAYRSIRHDREQAALFLSELRYRGPVDACRAVTCAVAAEAGPAKRSGRWLAFDALGLLMQLAVAAAVLAARAALVLDAAACFQAGLTLPPVANWLAAAMGLPVILIGAPANVQEARVLGLLAVWFACEVLLFPRLMERARQSPCLWHWEPPPLIWRADAFYLVWGVQSAALMGYVTWASIPALLHTARNVGLPQAARLEAGAAAAVWAILALVVLCKLPGLRRLGGSAMPDGGAAACRTLNGAMRRRWLLVLVSTITLLVVVVSGLAQRKGSWSAEEQPIADQLRGLRKVPDEARGGVTKQLALAIRRLPAGNNKVTLASNLANLSTEGDFGQDTLQEVATTLAGALQEMPAPDVKGQPAMPYSTLAQLARYEHVQVSLDAAPFARALAELETLDQRRASADFTLRDLGGRQWRLSGLRGKVVLVNFWATWCPPCRKEIPDLGALYSRFRKKGLVVLAISDEDAAKVVPFVKAQGVKYPVLLDAGRKVNEFFGVEGIPKSFVYDRKGKLVATAIDMRTQNQFLAMLAKAGIH
jgi:peroxiredoxin